MKWKFYAVLDESEGETIHFRSLRAARKFAQQTASASTPGPGSGVNVELITLSDQKPKELVLNLLNKVGYVAHREVVETWEPYGEDRCLHDDIYQSNNYRTRKVAT